MPRIEYERQLADLDAKVQAMGAHVKELYEKAYEATGTGRLEEGWSVDAAQSDNAAARVPSKVCACASCSGSSPWRGTCARYRAPSRW